MKRWLLLTVGLIVLEGCAAVQPPPCPCEQLAQDYDLTSDMLAQALRDKGVLRHRLKSCEERR